MEHARPQAHCHGPCSFELGHCSRGPPRSHSTICSLGPHRGNVDAHPCDGKRFGMHATDKIILQAMLALEQSAHAAYRAQRIFAISWYSLEL